MTSGTSFLASIHLTTLNFQPAASLRSLLIRSRYRLRKKTYLHGLYSRLSILGLQHENQLFLSIK